MGLQPVQAPLPKPSNPGSDVYTRGAPQPSTPAPELSPRDREWLTLYLDCNEDLNNLATRLASPAQAGCSTRQDSGLRTEDSGPSLLALAAWLRTPPIRAALADWDHAQRRARAARDEADRRVAIDALKAVCLALSCHQSCHQSWHPPCHRLAPSGDSLHSSTPSTKHAGADAPLHSSSPSAALALSADSAAPPSAASVLSADSAAPAFAALVETRRAATTLIRALSGAVTRRGHRHAPSRSPSHRLTVSPSHRGRPRRIADFNLGPAEAEKFLERERRENDRLQKLVERAVAVSDAARAGDHGRPPPSPPRGGGDRLERGAQPGGVEDPPWRSGSPQRSGGATEGAFSTSSSPILDPAVMAEAAPRASASAPDTGAPAPVLSVSQIERELRDIDAEWRWIGSRSAERPAAHLAARAGHAFADTG